MAKKLLLISSVSLLSLMSVANAEFDTIKEAVNSTTANKTYDMDGDENVIITLGTMGGSSLVINGNDYNLTVYGTGEISGLTVLTGDTFTIDNVGNVSKFSTEKDGAFLINSGTSTIRETKFTNNEADSAGGVIRNMGIVSSPGVFSSFGTIIIEKSEFEGNTGGIHGSAVLSNSGKATITNSQFKNNINGVIGNLGTVDIFSSTFDANIGSGAASGTATASGGAIRNHTTGIVNINITDDSALTTFSNNQSTDGGAIFTGTGATTNIKSTSFSDNEALNVGGVIYNAGTLNVLESAIVSSFKDNTAKVSGGAIYNIGSIVNLVANFTGNYIDNSLIASSTNSHGGALVNLKTIENISGIFDENYASASTKNALGGAIYNDGTIGEMSGAFTNNYVYSSEADAYGGAIRNNTTITKITSYFESNSAKTGTDGDAYGGAIANAGILETVASDFTLNTATSATGFAYGGAIQNNGDITILTSNFTSNTAISSATVGVAYGGAIYNTGLISSISGIYKTNYTDASNGNALGGAIYNAASGVINTISGEFEGNGIKGTSSVTDLGGAIYNVGLIDKIYADFTGNAVRTSGTVSSYGGAIYNAVGGKINDINGDFDGNYARGTSITASTSGSSGGDYGGAIANAGQILNITGVFTNNGLNSDFGGAISNSGTMFITNSSFSDNSVDAKGSAGAIYNIGEMEITNTLFSKNQVNGNGGNGGAIYNSGTMTLIKSDLSENNGGTYGKGGAIYNAATMTLIDTSLTDNTVGSSGTAGAIYNTGTLSILSSTESVMIENNKANSLDSGIYNTGTLNIDAAGGYAIVLNDKITGDTDMSTPSVININQTSIGNVKINNDVQNNTINFYSGILTLGRVTTGGSHIILNSYYEGSMLDTLIANDPIASGEPNRVINAIDGYITRYNITGDLDMSQTNLSLDIDLAKNKADSFYFADDSVVKADTGIVLVNVVDVDVNQKHGEIVIFEGLGQDTNPDIKLLEKDVNIVDFEKLITLKQDETNRGAYDYTVDLTDVYDLDRAIDLVSFNTQYNMDDHYGDETVHNNIIGFEEAATGNMFGKTMTVNGLAGGTDGYIVSSGEAGGDATLTLIDDSIYNSFNIHYDDVNFDLTGNGNSSLTFYMQSTDDFTFNKTVIDSEFTSTNQNNVLIFNGDGMYEITGNINNLTVAIDSYVDLTGDITNSIVNVDGLLATSSNISNSELHVENVLQSDGTISSTTINVGGMVERGGNDIGVTYNLNEDGVLTYDNMSHLYNSSMTKLNSINFNGGKLAGIQNNNPDKIKLNNIILSEDTNVSLDVDLRNKVMDTIDASTVTVNGGKFNIEYLNLLNDSLTTTTIINFTDTEELALATEYIGDVSIAYSPVYQYEVTYDSLLGDFTFERKSGAFAYNPASLSPSVARDASYIYISDLSEHVLMNTDSLDTHKFIDNSPSGDEISDKSAWMKVYGSNDNLDLEGIKVDSKSYGAILGIDSKVYELGKSEALYSGYIAYVGASQEYDTVDIRQSGAVIGARALFNQDNFFTGFTANIGMTTNEVTNAFGEEDFDTFTASISNKSGFTHETAGGRYLIQPSIMFSYVHGYTESYINSVGISLDSETIDALQIRPEIKIMAREDKGFTPYLSLSYNWNLISASNVIINDILLPDLAIDPYFELKMGAWKTIGDYLDFFAEVSGAGGGKEGIGGQLGLSLKF